MAALKRTLTKVTVRSTLQNPRPTCLLYQKLNSMNQDQAGYNSWISRPNCSNCLNRQNNGPLINHRRHFSTSSPPLCTNMKVWVSKTQDIFTNLALEDWLYKNQSFEEEKLLLLWRNTPCIVIGRHQNPWAECDVTGCQRDAVQVARRNSGGGAVYHDLGNMCVSFFTKRDDYDRKGNLQLVVAAVTDTWPIQLNINSRDDIILDNSHKISGTAAKLGGKTAYHHCTLLTDVNKENLQSYLTTNMMGLESHATESVRSEVRNLRDADPTITFEGLVEAISRKFTEETTQQPRIEYVDPGSTGVFPGLAEARDELRAPQWVFLRTPKFSLHRTFRDLSQDNNSRNLDMHLEVEKGRLADIRLEGRVLQGLDSLRNLIVLNLQDQLFRADIINTVLEQGYNNVMDVNSAKLINTRGMSVLLGLPDAKIEDGYVTDWSTNKIGGKPDWLCDPAAVTPRCGVCGQLCVLVVQVYCPLSGSTYHRTLYIFACTNKPCWNKQESWSALRCQILDTHSVKQQAPTDNKDDTDWGADADNWGDADSGADVAMATTDWCDSADNWGDDDENIPTLGTPKPSTESTIINTENESRVADLALQTERLQQMGISDSTGCEGGVDCEAECEAVSDCTPEGLSTVPVSDIQAVLNVPGREQSPVVVAKDAETCETLVSYYINVFEEPSSGDAANYTHEQRLLAAYAKQEGVKLDDLLHGDPSSGSSGGGKEGYEKATARHGDRTFHKFTKRLQACPQQIIRYEYAGQPVYIRTPPSAAVPACRSCGQPRVHELQLMPALVPLLQLSNQIGEALELGTVLVYTCRSNCWDDASNTPHIEHILFQPDPDQHLFR